MNLGFRLIAFSIALNFAIGIMLNAVPVFQANPTFSGGLYYNSSYTGAFSKDMQHKVNPNTVMSDSGNLVYRVLDMLSLGFISTFIQSIATYIYGVVVIFGIIFRGLLSEATYAFFFTPLYGVAYIIMDIVYAYGLFLLWTGKSGLFGE